MSNCVPYDAVFALISLKTMYHIKQFLDSVFAISVIIKASISVISLVLGPGC